MQRADLGAAVEKTEGKQQPEDSFGHRKRIGASTSNPSAPAKTKRPSREAETFYFFLSLKAETTPGNKRVNGYKPIG